MAKHTQNNNPFVKLFGEENNPFVKLLSEMNAPLCGPWKQAAAQYLATSEEWAQKALEWNEKMTAWAKETPIAPLFETQRSIASQMVENSIAVARRFWQLDTHAGEKAA